MAYFPYESVILSVLMYRRMLTWEPQTISNQPFFFSSHLQAYVDSTTTNNINPTMSPNNLVQLHGYDPTIIVLYIIFFKVNLNYAKWSFFSLCVPPHSFDY